MGQVAEYSGWNGGCIQLAATVAAMVAAWLQVAAMAIVPSTSTHLCGCGGLMSLALLVCADGFTVVVLLVVLLVA